MQTLTGHNFGHVEESMEILNEELELAIKSEDFLSEFTTQSNNLKQFAKLCLAMASHLLT